MAGARLSDVVLLLDADELARREAVQLIRKCHAVHLPAGTTGRPTEAGPWR